MMHACRPGSTAAEAPAGGSAAAGRTVTGWLTGLATMRAAAPMPRMSVSDASCSKVQAGRPYVLEELAGGWRVEVTEVGNPTDRSRLPTPRLPIPSVTLPVYQGTTDSQPNRPVTDPVTLETGVNRVANAIGWGVCRAQARTQAHELACSLTWRTRCHDNVFEDC